mmetsp:Transcript_14247/g.24233  ORF Transcript_14247/g.24233 Transcript_14247/m.24233 type:complete len:247 (-) Transcript_14247:3045-3785(-)
MNNSKIIELLNQCEHHDKDNRYMAAMDLCNEMLRISECDKIEEAMERRICSAFIKHLKDQSPDVQSIAVKSIQQIAPIIKEQNLVLIVESLASDVVDSKKKEVRDIFSLAIRSTIDELKDQAAMNMIKTVYPKLEKGLQSQGSDKEEVQEECLDILSEIFKKFGGLLQKNNNLVNKDQSMSLIYQLLQASNKEVRKRATICMGQLSAILSAKNLHRLVSVILEKLKQHISGGGSKDDLLTHVQCLS